VLVEEACWITNEPFRMVVVGIKIVASAATASAVVGTSFGTVPEAQFESVTAVLVALGVSVTVPTAFDRPDESCCSVRMTFTGSLLVRPST
jgi:hypothetical protein